MLSVLLLSGLLAGCGTDLPEQQNQQEPEPTPESVSVYTATFQQISPGLSALLPLCASEDGFFCASTEKTGENIPDQVIRQARQRNREPYNDGRYDLLSPAIWFVSADGTAEALPAYIPLAAESTPEGWRGFACEPGVEALGPGEGNTLLSLEYNAISGNSAPLQRAQQVIGKNYREYRLVWHLRTLNADGSEQSDRIVEGDREAAFSALQARISPSAPKVFSASETPIPFADLGIAAEDICSPILQRSDGSFLFLIGSRGAEEIVTVKQEERETSPQSLLLAAESRTPLLEEAVLAFNRTHPDLIIALISLEGAEERHADLYCLTAEACRTMAKAGKLADLYPFIDADKSLKRSLLFSNILQALEVDGGLYCTCAGVSFETVIGASSLVGEKAGWTYDEFLQAWSRFGIGTDAFDAFTTAADVLHACLTADLPLFFDRDDGISRFTEEAFTRLLYFTRNFPRQIDLSAHSFIDADASDLRLQRGKQMLLEKTLCNMTDALYCGYEYPEEVTFIGYPTLSGTGNVMTVSTLETGLNLSMAETSTRKEAAWQFLRTFFTEDYQKSYRYFPVNINAFNRSLTAAMQVDYVLDEKGNPVTDRATGEKVKRSIDTMYLSNYTAVNIYPLTDSQAEKLVDLMRSTTKLKTTDEEVQHLVRENASGFWEGTVSLEESAQRVQDAVMKTSGE